MLLMGYIDNRLEHNNISISLKRSIDDVLPTDIPLSRNLHLINIPV